MAFLPRVDHTCNLEDLQAAILCSGPDGENRRERDAIHAVYAGLDLEQERQTDAEISDNGEVQSPTKASSPAKPCNYLSAMLTYIAQVGLKHASSCCLSAVSLSLQHATPCMHPCAAASSSWP